MVSKPLVIAVDGPAGVGKSTVARALAWQLGYRYLDTGAMYRALTWKAMQAGCDLDDTEALTRLAQVSVVEIKPDPQDMRITIDDQDVTAEIRAPEVSRRVSYVARVAGVREAMVLRQRQLGQAGGIVAEGRDIGTVVFPAADLKIFLVASSTERARRRGGDLAQAGHQIELVALESELQDRARIDSTREVAPLVASPDAAVIDTEPLSAAQVVEQIMALVRPLVACP